MVGIPRHVVYCASKGGVNQLTKVLALEWSSRGVAVKAAGPTFIYTPGTVERLDEPEFRQSVIARLPMAKSEPSTMSPGQWFIWPRLRRQGAGTLLLVDGG